MPEDLREDPYHWTELPSLNKDYYYHYYYFYHFYYSGYLPNTFATASISDTPSPPSFLAAFSAMTKLERTG